MGRAGSGGGRAGGGHSGGGSRSGGGMRSGGGHSSSGFNRTSGGSSGSRRAGSGTSSGSRAGMGSSSSGDRRGGMGGAGMPGGMGTPGGMGGRRGMNPPPPGGRRHRFFGFWPFWRRGGYGDGYYRGGYGGGCLGSLLIGIVILILIFVFAFGRLGSGFRMDRQQDTVVNNQSSAENASDSGTSADDDSSVNSTADENSSGTSAKKITSDLTFDSDCITDELGWVDDIEATTESLEEFFDITGIQPYVYFRAYDDSLTSEAEKDDYAQQWYEDQIDNEQSFLFIYFAEEDSENDVGYMSCVYGYDAESLIGDEELELFWDYVDRYWYSNLSTDSMLERIFDSFADAIL